MDKLDGNLIVSPSLFLAFGSPMQAIDFDEYNEALCDFLGTVAFPRSILIVSPFWVTDNIKINSVDYPELIYDFDEGPETLKILTYPCSGNPDLAVEIKNLLDSRDIEAELEMERGLDKGCWIPLYVAFPDMDVPVVQMSIPKNASPEELFRIGNTLSDLRKTGVMIITVGNTVYDETNFDLEYKYKGADDWAKELDNWIYERVKSRNYKELFNANNFAPHASKINISRLSPLYFMLGTTIDNDVSSVIFDDFYYGNTAMRSFVYINNR